MSKDVYIVDGIRTPIGNFCGTLSSLHARRTRRDRFFEQPRRTTIFNQ